MTIAVKTIEELPTGNYRSTHPACLIPTENPAYLPQDKTGFFNSTTYTNKQKGDIIAEDLQLTQGRTNRYVRSYFNNNLPVTIIREVDYQAFIKTGKVTELWTLLVYFNHNNPTAYNYKTGAGLVKKLQQLK